MKKLLLLSALAISALGMNAASFGDYFKVEFEGKEIANGETIIIAEPEYADEWGQMWAAPVKVINLQDEYRPVFGELMYSIPATRTDLRNEQGARAQLCYAGAYRGLNNCLSNGNETCVSYAFVNVPEAGVDTFEWDVDVNYDESQLSNPVTLQLNMFAAEGDGEKPETCELIDGTDFTMTIVFGAQATVVGITDEAAAPVYYNLQGMRVANPEKGGLYIVKKGTKTMKKVF